MPIGGASVSSSAMGGLGWVGLWCFCYTYSDRRLSTFILYDDDGDDDVM